MTEVRERASVRVGGENEGNEVDRVGGSEFRPSSILSTSRMKSLRGALLLHMHAHLVLSHQHLLQSLFSRCRVSLFLVLLQPPYSFF